MMHIVNHDSIYNIMIRGSPPDVPARLRLGFFADVYYGIGTIVVYRSNPFYLSIFNKLDCIIIIRKPVIHVHN